MIRFLRVLAKMLVLIIVALASALVSMRFAIHGREVAVPDFRGLPPAVAERLAFERGLELSHNDHFFSATVPAGRIVSQQPEPGTKVRRGFRVQAAESLGVQLIEIPTVVGMSQRAAEINIRRRGLEMGEAAELPMTGATPQAILAQTPSPGAQGIASPRVSLLQAAPPPDAAYAMPDLTGMTLPEATSLITAAGMKAASATTLPSSGTEAPVVVGQNPAAGSRVTPGTAVTLQLART